MFSSANSIDVETADGKKVVTFDQCIIAAGSEPVTLPFIPHDDPRVIDSTGALELEDETEKKAELALTIAKAMRSENQFSSARSWARTALEHKPGWGEPYILIGDLYASSGSICGGMDGELAALAALDKYAVAKKDPESAETAQSRINKYSAYMPTITYLFERGLNEGDSYTYKCWIAETTTLRGKKSN